MTVGEIESGADWAKEKVMGKKIKTKNKIFKIFILKIKDKLEQRLLKDRAKLKRK